MSTINWAELLPEGWKHEQLQRSDDYVSIVAPPTEKFGGGGITIDFRLRGFRLGWTTIGRLDSTEKYTGSRWQTRLVKDAIKKLASIYR